MSVYQNCPRPTDHPLQYHPALITRGENQPLTVMQMLHWAKQPASVNGQDAIQLEINLHYFYDEWSC